MLCESAVQQPHFRESEQGIVTIKNIEEEEILNIAKLYSVFQMKKLQIENYFDAYCRVDSPWPDKIRVRSVYLEPTVMGTSFVMGNFMHS